MSPRLDQLSLRRVAIWGYGKEGQAALRLLRQQYPQKKIGLIVTPEEAERWHFELDPLLEVITDAPSPGVFGNYQIVIKSPGISPYAHQRAMEWAHFRGTRFISGSALWFAQHGEDKTVCITGTKGKSTTSALTAHLLQAGGTATLLAGNIGTPLLDVLEPDPAPEVYVVELSSFQCFDFAGVPAIATVLNLSPEHLDWHGSEQQYYSDKLKILAEGRADVAVLNAADERLRAMTHGIERKVWFNDPEHWHARGDSVWHGGEKLIDLAATQLMGAHNASNIAAACTMIELLGVEPRRVVDALRAFRPLPHRLQRLGERRGRHFIDDSISTTPEATLAALSSLNAQTLAVLVGGHDRGIDWRDFAERVLAHPPRAIVGVGAHGARIVDTLATQWSGLAGSAHPALAQASDLKAAIARAEELTPLGGTILLSPGAPSFDAFKDYAERGQRFAEWAGFETTRS